MRQFAKDAPEFFCFQLEGSDTVHKIPLAASMPVPLLRKMDEGPLGQFDILAAYMGAESDGLDFKQVGEIIKAWLEASKEQGATVGESSALSE